ncbi:MAG: phage holin family protein [Sphingomonadaceae bacterium]
MTDLALRDLLAATLANDQVRLILALIGADVLLGIAASIRAGQFQLSRLAAFLGSKVVPYILGYGAVRLVAEVMPEWQPYSTAVWLVVVAALVGDLTANLQQLGLPVPPALTKTPAKEQ